MYSTRYRRAAAASSASSSSSGSALLLPDYDVSATCNSLASSLADTSISVVHNITELPPQIITTSSENHEQVLATSECNNNNSATSNTTVTSLVIPNLTVEEEAPDTPTITNILVSIYPELFSIKFLWYETC